VRLQLARVLLQELLAHRGVFGVDGLHERVDGHLRVDHDLASAGKMNDDVRRAPAGLVVTLGFSSKSQCSSMPAASITRRSCISPTTRARWGAERLHQLTGRGLQALLPEGEGLDLAGQGAVGAGARLLDLLDLRVDARERLPHRLQRLVDRRLARREVGLRLRLELAEFGAREIENIRLLRCSASADSAANASRSRACASSTDAIRARTPALREPQREANGESDERADQEGRHIHHVTTGSAPPILAPSRPMMTDDWRYNQPERSKRRIRHRSRRRSDRRAARRRPAAPWTSDESRQTSRTKRSSATAVIS